jgi:hypothetical protein
VDVCILQVDSNAASTNHVTRFFPLSCRDVTEQEKISAWGYPGSYSINNPLGYVSGGIGQDGLVPSSIAFVPGMSGGPVLDENGFVIGVIYGAGTALPQWAVFTPLLYVRSLLLRVGIDCRAPPVSSSVNDIRFDEIQTAQVQVSRVDDFMRVSVNGNQVEDAKFGETPPWRTIKPYLKRGPNSIFVLIINGQYGGCGGELQLRINGSVVTDFTREWSIPMERAQSTELAQRRYLL